MRYIAGIHPDNWDKLVEEMENLPNDSPKAKELLWKYHTRYWNFENDRKA